MQFEQKNHGPSPEDKVDAPNNRRELSRSMRSYCLQPEFRASTSDANRHLAATIAALLGVGLVAILVDKASFPEWFRIVLFAMTAILLGLVVFRFFVIAHDCVHSSFYPSMLANRRLGMAISLITLTPHQGLADSHLRHHRESGKLDSKIAQFNHTVWLTSQQYAMLPLRKRLMYRVIRDPFVFFLLAPVFNFLRGLCLMKRSWISSLSAIVTGYMLYRFGSIGLMLTWLAGHYVFNALTIFGVHIQHTFNPAYCKEQSQWRFEDAALLGSSYHTTFGAGWFFLGVEHHAIHHFAPRIPVYRLRECYAGAQSTFWLGIKKKSFLEALSLTKLVLFNQANEKFESFGENRARRLEADH